MLVTPNGAPVEPEAPKLTPEQEAELAQVPRLMITMDFEGNVTTRWNPAGAVEFWSLIMGAVRARLAADIKSELLLEMQAGMKDAAVQARVNDMLARGFPRGPR